jgi:UV DNA damage endonuclease
VAHRLGFAVKVLDRGGLPSHDTRRWQSGPHLRVSLERLEAIFDYLEQIDVRMYRMTSNLVPYGSHPDLPQFHRQIEECAEELARLGRRAADAGLRLSSHPGQYIVLNSEKAEVRAAAVRELEMQADLLDAMELGPEAVVVLHIGGAAGGCEAGIERFLAGFELLSERARSRLVIENDDVSFGLGSVLRLASQTGSRVVWDALHHRCLDPDRIPPQEALALALDTWRDGSVPKIHYSSPRTTVEERKRKVGRRVERQIVLPPLRAHADLIDPIGFERFLLDAPAERDFDVMLEAKAKDLALQRLRDQLLERGFGWEHGQLLRPAAPSSSTR